MAQILILVVSYLENNSCVVLVFSYLDDLSGRGNFTHRIEKKIIN